jgi:hypothetical protein
VVAEVETLLLVVMPRQVAVVTVVLELRHQSQVPLLLTVVAVAVVVVLTQVVRVVLVVLVAVVTVLHFLEQAEHLGQQTQAVVVVVCSQLAVRITAVQAS